MMTLLSRILGLVRDVVFARFFGASIVMDAFFVANKIPNMLRRFSGEGAFSQGFVRSGLKLGDLGISLC